MATNSPRISLPTFDGKHKNFSMFWSKIKAYAALHGYSDMISKQKATSLPNEREDNFDNDANIREKQEEAVARNRLAVANFTMAFKTQALMNMITRSQSDEWPSGQAHLVVKQLLDEYNPTDLVAGIEMQRDLAKLRFKKQENPKAFFNKIADIEAKYGQKVTEDDKLKLIMGKAPAEYVTGITAEKRRNSAATVGDIESVMMEHYRITKGVDTDSEADSDDGSDEGSKDGVIGLTAVRDAQSKAPSSKASTMDEMDVKKIIQEEINNLALLFAPNVQHQPPQVQASQQYQGNNQNNGTTANRSGYAHHQGENVGPRRFNGQCFICGRTGHQAARCWHKPENAHLRPPGWTPNNQYIGQQTSPSVCEQNNTNHRNAPAIRAEMSNNQTNHQETQIAGAAAIHYLDDDDDKSVEFHLVSVNTTITECIEEEMEDDESQDGTEISSFEYMDEDNIEDADKEDFDNVVMAMANDQENENEDWMPDETCASISTWTMSEEEVNMGEQTTKRDIQQEEVDRLIMWVMKELKTFPDDKHGLFPTLKRRADELIRTQSEEEDGFHNLALAKVNQLTFNPNKNLLLHPNVWIGDTGATTHLTPHKNGFTNLKKSDKKSAGATWGNGETTKTSMIGDIPGVMFNKNGVPLRKATITNVEFMPEAVFNLFSLTKLQKDGWELYGNHKGFVVTKGEMKLVFDIAVRTGEGILWCMYFARQDVGEMTNVALTSKKRSETMNIKEAHAKLGHFGEDLTRKTVKLLGWTLSRGTLGTCEPCTIGKAKQKNVPKAQKSPLKKGHSRMHTDTATMKNKKGMPKFRYPIWDMKTIEPWGLKFCEFYKRKSDMIEPTCKMLYRWQQDGKGVNYVRLDNAGENYSLKSRCESDAWKLILNWEFTSRNTPQQNSSVEVAFWVIKHRGIAMMTAANLPKAVQYMLYKEAFKTACMLDWLAPIQIGGVTKMRYEHWANEIPAFAQHLRVWGEAGTVTFTTKTTSKLEDRGRQCMFVGYEPDHPGDCYRMWYPKTNKILVTRDVIWLHRMFFPSNKPTVNITTKATKDTKQKTLDPIVDLEVNTSGGSSQVSQLEDTMSAAPPHTSQQIDHQMENNEQKNEVDETEAQMDDEWDDHPYAGFMVEAADDPHDLFQNVFKHQNEEEEIHFSLSDNESVAESDHEANSTDTKQSHSQKKGSEKAEEDMSSMAQSYNQQTVRRSNRNTNKPGWMDDYVAAAVASKPQGTNPMDDETLMALGQEAKMLNEFAQRMLETEVAVVGMGNAFANTQELNHISYKKAMKSKDREKWEQAIEEEYNKMKKHQVFEPIPMESVPQEAIIMAVKWIMKRKANGTFRARITAKGYEQVDGVHYDADNIASPVVDDLTIMIVLVLTILGGWAPQLVDVKGAFLNGHLDPKHKMYIRVPEGFEKWFGTSVVLLLCKALYGTKQAAIQFYSLISQTFMKLFYVRSKADPCLFYKWSKEDGLLLWLTWVDDCLCTGKDAGVQKGKEEFKTMFDCDDLGPLEEYVGCKIEYDREKRQMKLTQPVLLQSLEDEFEIDHKGQVPKTPAPPGQVLPLVDTETIISPEEQTKFRSGVGKLIHLMKWSRPEIGYAVRELSKYMKQANAVHVKQLHRLFRHLVTTKKRGLILAPIGQWNGDPQYAFEVSGISDSNYAPSTGNRKSVSGWSVFLNWAVVRAKSRQQNCVTLSVTEAELIAATECVQDMVRVKNVLESIGLRAKLPMRLYVDNRGVVDLINNHSVGGRTRHIDVRYWWIRELKEAGTVSVQWIMSENNSADLYTKNLPEELYQRHIAAFVTDE